MRGRSRSPLGPRSPSALRVWGVAPFLLAQLPHVAETAAQSSPQATEAAAPSLPPLDEYHVRVFDVADGLPVSEVWDLEQSREGYLYVASARGLSRFDGYRFRSVELPGFSSTFLRAVHEDRQGRLWVLSAMGDLGYRWRGRFRVLAQGLGPASTMADFSETSDGTIWVRSGGTLARVRPEAEAPVTRFSVADGLPEGTVHAVLDAPGGERVVWIGGRLARLEPDSTRPGGVRFVPFGPRLESGRLFHPSYIRPDSTGVWLPFTDHVLQYREGRFTRHGPGSKAFDRIWHDGAYVHRIGGSFNKLRRVRSPDGTLWLGYVDLETGRHHLVRGRGGAFERLALREHLDFKQIERLLEDHEGNLWVSTDRGLIQLSPRRVYALGARHGLAEMFTVPVLQSRDGAVWVGTWGGGLHRFADGRLTHRYTSREGLPGDQVRALFEAEDGTLWVGGSPGFAALRDGRIALAQTVQGEVRGFAETPDGRFWIGGQYDLRVRTGRGLVEYRPDVFHGREIWAVRASRDGSLWVGAEHGLFRITGDSVRAFGVADGLRSPFVVSIHGEEDGTLWFGTYGSGLHRYRDGRFVAVTSREGLHHDGVWRMLETPDGGVWMSSDQGVFRVDRDRLHRVADALTRGERPEAPLSPVVFTEAEGMPSREGNRGSPGGWRLRDGRLVFNNLKGLVVIDPARATEPLPAPRAVLVGISADGRPLDGEPQEVVELPGATRHLAFEFAALSFAAPEQNRYRYRLEGYDEAWIANGTRSRASYTNLPPGRYTFQVQGTTGMGTWGTPAAYTFAISPRVWQTLWFRLLALTAVAGLLALAYRIRIRHLLEMQRLRLRIASDLHDDIGSNISSIALLSEMLRGDTRLEGLEGRQLERIHDAAEETIEVLRDVIWQIHPEHDTLADLVRRMRKVASELLDGTLHTFQAPEPLEPRELSMRFMRNVYLLYKEALHNIVRHARARHVTIEISTDHRRFLLRIRDDGAGFDVSGDHRGHGLESMRRRAKEAGGEIEIRSEPGEGTEIRFSTRMA